MTEGTDETDSRLSSPFTLGVSSQVRADDINIQRGSDRAPDTKTRTSPIFPDFLDCFGLAFLLFFHPTHGFLDRLKVIASLLCALVGLLLKELELGLESLEVVDRRNGIRRVSDERGEQRRR